MEGARSTDQPVKPERFDSGTPEPGDSERTADTYSPAFSVAALNILDYRFGTTFEATRPDQVMRIPTAALLIQRCGQLYEHFLPGQRVLLPKVALLGPTYKVHIWETAPKTRFTLVNLAPGATQALFGIDPRDVLEQVEPLTGTDLSDVLFEPGLENAEGLNDYLCHRINERGMDDWHMLRARRALLSLRQEQFGPHVRDYAEHFGVTPRTLQRIVNKAVGLTTKQVLAIQRIRRLITLTGLGWSRSVADLAQEGGFYDQSHMRYDLLRLGIDKVSQLTEGNHIVTEF